MAKASHWSHYKVFMLAVVFEEVASILYSKCGHTMALNDGGGKTVLDSYKNERRTVMRIYLNAKALAVIIRFQLVRSQMLTLHRTL